MACFKVSVNGAVLEQKLGIGSDLLQLTSNRFTEGHRGPMVSYTGILPVNTGLYCLMPSPVLSF